MSVQVEKPVEAHIQYIRDTYDRLNEYSFVKKAKSGYGKTKHSFGLLEKTLDYIEGTAYNATNKIAIPAYESYGYSVTNSLLNLYTRGANLLINTAIFTKSIRYFVGQLNQKLALADLVRQRRDWAFEKYSFVTSSVSDLRDKVANQASQLNILPEKMLLDSIRRTSINLSENMEKFRNKSSKLLNDGVISSQIESTTSYIQHLVSTFSEANDIYQIKDGVLDEAQHHLTEVAQLVSSPFFRHSSVSVDSTSTNDGPILNSFGENSPVDNFPLSSDSGEE